MPSKSSISLTLAKFRRRMFKHYFGFKRLAIGGVILVVLIIGIYSLVPVARLVKEFIFGPVNIFSIVFPNSSTLKNDNGRINILLLGIGGIGHDGPNLTDAIMVLSVQTKPKNGGQNGTLPVTLISVPRDIYLDTLQNKINSAYQTGVERGVGMALAKGVVSQVVGIPIHYALVVDFSAFDDVVDILGGVDVNVEHTLDDYGYPIEGKENDTCGFLPEEVATRAAAITILPSTEQEAFPCRYEHLHFDTGRQHMAGASALAFVRSRHAQGDEGTDFARGRRQQLVLKAVQNKVLSGQTILSPQKIWDLFGQLKSHINSDMSPAETNALINLAIKFRNSPIKTVAIDQDLLENPPIDYRGWILLSKDGTWDQVHEFVKVQLESQ